MKAMLVDDSIAMRRIQKNMLAAMNVEEVLEAKDGKEAMAHLANGPVDVLLLDWNMPKLDGFETLKAIRSDARLVDVKIIMCTSESEKGRILEAIKAGADSYIVKPFTVEVLKEKLKDLGLA